MNIMGQKLEGLIAPQVERRRHARYRLQEPLLIRRNDGSSYQATTSEISISGLSAATTGVLRAGEEVRLSPVVGEQVSAIVRRKVGRMYGFEFTSVPPKVEEEIHILCRGLVPFRGLSD
jgi:hypothetical protein